MIKFKYHSTLKDGTTLNTFYSDEGRYLVHNDTGTPYDKVIDKVGSESKYTEGGIIPTDTTDMTETEEKAKAYDILMGGE